MHVQLGPRWPRVVAAVTLGGASLCIGAAVGSIFLITARDAWSALGAAGPAGPADGILLVAGMSGALLALWIGLSMTLSALSTLPGALGLLCQQLAARIAPSAVRKTVAFILGTTLTAALVPGNAVAGIRHEARAHVATSASGQALGNRLADAAPDASFRLLSEPVHDRRVIDAAPRPDWSPGPMRAPRESASPARLNPAGERVVVHGGDTLWSIAARHLGPAANAADIDSEWRRWLATNLDVIGNDANLILPGQRLHPPTSSQEG